MAGEGVDRIPTNEEIIEDLTRDIQNAQTSTSTNSEEVRNSDSSQHIPSDFDKDNNDEDQPPANRTSQSDLDDTDDEELKNQDLELTEEEREAKRQEAIALKVRGNDELKSGQFAESVETYTQALSFCPLRFPNDRAILYANRAAAKISLGHKDIAIKDCSKAIQLNDRYVRAYLRRAKLYEDTNKLDESLADYTKILELDPGNKDALAAAHRLPPLIEVRNEKLKAEMIDKFKDLGNLFLRPFGLSTDNFKVNQDPGTGGYSLNFQQNK